MEKTPYIWMNGTLIPWEEAKTHVICHSLHYGSGVFEGIRFYETTSGEPAIFRLEEHTKRLFYSANVVKMHIPYSEDEINTATKEIVRTSGITAGYIRPLGFFGEKMGLNPKGAPVHVLIAAWGWGKYLADRPLRVKISQYIRIHPKSVIADAKVSGHYVNSILASQEAEEGYDEAILLDFEGNVAEGPGENIFIVKDGTLITPSFGKILKGITRDAVLTLAKDFGISVEERTIAPEELFSADEAFFTGTAAEVSPIGSIDDRQIGNGEEGPITHRLREAFFDIVHGRSAKYENWITRVK
jgi:branched-chain amino acid aminotransferase